MTDRAPSVRIVVLWHALVAGLLLLVADEEMSYDEVATVTDQTPDAVRGKLHRARKAFAALFAQTDQSCHETRNETPGSRSGTARH